MASDPATERPTLPSGLWRLWGFDRGSRPGQRPSLDIRQVAEAAVAVADAEGLDAVSMGRVANELAVSTMALYRYVDGKDDLLEVMMEVGAGDPPPLEHDLDWREATRIWAQNLAALYRAHLWALDVPLQAPPRGPHQLAWMEQCLAALRGSGLDVGDRIQILMLILAHVRGEVTTERQLASALADAKDGGSVERDYAAQLRHVLAGDRFPELTHALESGIWDEDGADDDRGALSGAFGLERILDGVDALVRRRVTTRAVDLQGGQGGR